MLTQAPHDRIYRLFEEFGAISEHVIFDILEVEVAIVARIEGGKDGDCVEILHRFKLFLLNLNFDMVVNFLL